MKAQQINQMAMHVKNIETDYGCQKQTKYIKYAIFIARNICEVSSNYLMHEKYANI